MIQIKPIGLVHSPFKKSEGTPIQPTGSKNKGELEIFKEYTTGLTDLNGFSHIIVLYQFHMLVNEPLMVKPFMDTEMHGVFSTRSPARPNRIGLSILQLEEVVENRVIVNNLDMLDQTPIIDIKPYVPQFDACTKAKIGWLETNIHKHFTAEDDGRFL